MRTIPLALIGYGNVGKAFSRLLIHKRAKLLEEFDLQFIVTGILTRRHGGAVNVDGIDQGQALARVDTNRPLSQISTIEFFPSSFDFLKASQAEVLIETTPVNHHTGEPCVSHIRQAFELGMHAVTANKGPVALAYEELQALATKAGKRFLFESAVMDGAPIFSLVRETLPAAEISGFTGILNSCSNFILGLLDSGMTLEDAIEESRRIGITETDPSADLDGWDAAIKIAALSRAVLGLPLTPVEVAKDPVSSITPQMMQQARDEGKKWKMVCTARKEDGKLAEANVKAQMISPDSPLYSVNGTSSYIEFHTDVLPALGITENDPGPETTAYGMLADLLTIYKDNH